MYDTYICCHFSSISFISAWPSDLDFTVSVADKLYFLVGVSLNAVVDPDNHDVVTSASFHEYMHLLVEDIWLSITFLNSYVQLHQVPSPSNALSKQPLSHLV